MTLDPGQIEVLKKETTKKLYKNAVLFGMKTSTVVILYGKPALWIPRAVSSQPGGRDSIYDLKQGEEVLLGIYVVNLQIVQEIATRLSETRYAMSHRTLGGEEIFRGEGDMEIIDSQIGHGKVSFDGERTDVAKILFHVDPGTETKTMVWVLWSCIKVVHEDK